MGAEAGEPHPPQGNRSLPPWEVGVWGMSDGGRNPAMTFFLQQCPAALHPDWGVPLQLC